jgi:hypothetical protein
MVSLSRYCFVCTRHLRGEDGAPLVADRPDQRQGVCGECAEEARGGRGYIDGAGQST